MKLRDEARAYIGLGSPGIWHVNQVAYDSGPVGLVIAQLEWALAAVFGIDR